MSTLFLINGIVTLIVSIYILSNFLKNCKNCELKKIAFFLLIISFCYLLFSTFSFLWYLNVLDYNELDFRIIFSFAIIVQTLVLFKLNYALNKKTAYLLLFYLAVLLSAYISIVYAPSLILIISYLLTLIFSLNVLFVNNYFKKAGYAGIFYSLVSVLFEFALLFGIGESFLFTIISSIFFLFFISYLLNAIEKYPLKFQSKFRIKKEPYVALFIKYFIFIIALTNLSLIGTVGIHEFSHVSVSRAYGCESKSIVYEKGIYPYTEIICNDLSGKVPIALSGPVIPIILGVILFFVGGKFLRSISLLMIGFNLAASYKDLQDIGVSPNLILVSVILGIAFLLSGIVMMAKARVEEDHQISLNVGRNINFEQSRANQ